MRNRSIIKEDLMKSLSSNCSASSEGIGAFGVAIMILAPLEANIFGFTFGPPTGFKHLHSYYDCWLKKQQKRFLDTLVTVKSALEDPEINIIFRCAEYRKFNEFKVL